MIITSIFLALLTCMLVFHSVRVIGARRQTMTSLGDGGHEVLERRIRIQGNFVEYVPFLLGLLAMLEYGGAPAWVLWVFGGLAVVGRLCHAYGIWSKTTPMWGRVAGMAITFTLLIGGALGVLYLQVL